MNETACREYAAALRERAKTVAGGFREDFLRLAQVWEREAASIAARTEAFATT